MISLPLWIVLKAEQRWTCDPLIPRLVYSGSQSAGPLTAHRAVQSLDIATSRAIWQACSLGAMENIFSSCCALFAMILELFLSLSSGSECWTHCDDLKRLLISGSFVRILSQLLFSDVAHILCCVWEAASEWQNAFVEFNIRVPCGHKNIVHNILVQSADHFESAERKIQFQRKIRHTKMPTCLIIGYAANKTQHDGIKLWSSEFYPHRNHSSRTGKGPASERSFVVKHSDGAPASHAECNLLIHDEGCFVCRH